MTYCRAQPGQFKSLSGRNDIDSIDYKALVKNVQNLSKPSLESIGSQN